MAAPQSSTRTVRVAVTQAAAAPHDDLKRGVTRTCELIAEAAKGGAKLVAFPECWLTGYPYWIWARPVDFDLAGKYLQSSLKVDSPEMEQIRSCAKDNAITVVLGFSEHHHMTAYISQALISAEGEILLHRRKMKPTHMERTIFGDGSGDCLKNVANTTPELGRVGMLACWEHTQPLLKFHTYLQREEIHVAAWPPLFPHDGGPGLFSMTREGCRALSRAYAIESGTFVLHTTSIIPQEAIDSMQTATGALFNAPGGGGSAVFGPDGRMMSKDIPHDEEGIIFADLDFADVVRSKGFLDVCGHYSRPDLLWLGVDEKEKELKMPLVK